MLCEKCGQREATYHSTVNINGEITESHLCSECAIGENKLNHLFNVGNFFKPSLFEFGQDAVSKPKNTKLAKTCSFCGKTYEDFLKTGLLGCANCYDTFKQDLIPVLNTMQFDVIHTGKQFVQEDEEMDETTKTIKNLEFKLKQAVATENYELASELKKQINELKLGEDGHESE